MKAFVAHFQCYVCLTVRESGTVISFNLFVRSWNGNDIAIQCFGGIELSVSYAIVHKM